VSSRTSPTNTLHAAKGDRRVVADAARDTQSLEAIGEGGATLEAKEDSEDVAAQ
jgi:hypothetical protein